MLHDARPPAPAPAAGLKLMLQEMQEHDHEIALHGLLRADAPILDLLGQVDDVDALENSLPQEPGLLLDPQAKVPLVQRRPSFGHKICARHVPNLYGSHIAILARDHERADSATTPIGAPACLGGYSLRICLIRAIASSTACSGLMPSVTMRWIAFAQTRSL